MLIPLLCAGPSLAGPAASAPADAAAPAGGASLVPYGDWYVLVHYRDLGAAGDGDPTATDDAAPAEWDDEVWRIARADDRVVWIVHPHVALRDRTGRFETLASGEEARTVGPWSPSPGQLAEIRDGLELDPHAVRSKTLRGSERAGYASSGAPRAASASAIAYGEAWSIGGRPGRAELVRRSTLASGRAESAQGTTRFEIREGPTGAGEWRGRYARDGRFVGTFRMIPTVVAPGGRP